jgi:redox-sensitive bicupin YhaK (pirin superfamily)
VQVARGGATVNGVTLAEGDGAAIEEEARITVEGREGSQEGEVLVFDLG